MPTTPEIAAVICSRWDELTRDTGNRKANITCILNAMLNAQARCIYCNAVYDLTTPEDKEALTNHIMSCEKNPMTEIYKAAQGVLDEHRALIGLIKHMEIHAGYLHNGYLQMDTKEKQLYCNCIGANFTPLAPEFVVEKATDVARQLETAKRIMNAQELRLRELGDEPSEAVAVIGEPVHPAFHERDEATRDAKTLAPILVMTTLYL